MLSEWLRAVQHWLDLNCLSMNPNKTEAIVIGTGARKLMEGLANTVDLGCVVSAQRAVFEVWESRSMTRYRSLNM